MGFTNSSGEARYLCFARIQAVTAPCFTRWGRANSLLQPGLVEAVEVTVKEAGINAQI